MYADVQVDVTLTGVPGAPHVQYAVHDVDLHQEDDDLSSPFDGGIAYEPVASNLTRAPRGAFADSLDTLDDED
jgi:hypothetical protein